jgi:hypothetical protein
MLELGNVASTVRNVITRLRTRPSTVPFPRVARCALVEASTAAECPGPSSRPACGKSRSALGRRRSLGPDHTFKRALLAKHHPPRDTRKAQLARPVPVADGMRIGIGLRLQARARGRLTRRPAGAQGREGGGVRVRRLDRRPDHLDLSERETSSNARLNFAIVVHQPRRHSTHTRSKAFDRENWAICVSQQSLVTVELKPHVIAPRGAREWNPCSSNLPAD